VLITEERNSICPNQHLENCNGGKNVQAIQTIKQSTDDKT
jgi:hypothetical protein